MSLEKRNIVPFTKKINDKENKIKNHNLFRFAQTKLFCWILSVSEKPCLRTARNEGRSSAESSKPNFVQDFENWKTDVKASGWVTDREYFDISLNPKLKYPCNSNSLKADKWLKR